MAERIELGTLVVAHDHSVVTLSFKALGEAETAVWRMTAGEARQVCAALLNAADAAEQEA